MNFGLISLDFKRFPLEKCFKTASLYGFQGVEIWGGRPHAYPYDMDRAEVRKILDYKKKYRIETPMYTPNAIGLPFNLCSSLAKEREEGISYYKRAIDTASALEIPKMLIVADHPGFERDYTEVWNCFSEAISELAAYAQGRNVIISVEPLTPVESPVITGTDDCLRLMGDVQAPNLQFVLDIVPPIVINEPISDYFVKLQERVSHVHIAGCDGITDAHLGLAQGVVDIQDVLQILKDNNYDQYVIAEMYSASVNDPESVTASAAKVLNNVQRK